MNAHSHSFQSLPRGLGDDRPRSAATAARPTHGCRADLVALDLTDLSLQPTHRLLQNVVYSLQPSAIRHVYVDGEAVVRDGRLVRVREEEIAARVERLRAREQLWR